MYGRRLTIDLTSGAVTRDTVPAKSWGACAKRSMKFTAPLTPSGSATSLGRERSKPSRSRRPPVLLLPLAVTSPVTTRSHPSPAASRA